MAHDEDNGFAEWGGYFEAKKSKLEEQFAAASDPFRKSNLFAGISIFVNGLTNPSADELKRIMMVHGGTYHHYERPHTTFIIASNLPDVKVRNMDTSKIIAAQWVVDCVQKERVLDYKPYLLYTNQKTTQPRLNFGKSKKEKEANSSTVTICEQVATTTQLEGQLGSILKELQQAALTATSNDVSKPADNTSINATVNGNAARTAVDPAFLSEFYKKSRLHHIATLGAGFKQYVCELRQAHGNKPFGKRAELKSLLPDSLGNDTARYVMHIDMDCFFVSVGLRNHPELRGLPIAVTHSKGGSSATDVPVHPQANRQVELELFAQRFEQHQHDNIRADKVRTGFEEKMSLSEIASCSYEARAKGIRNGMFVGQALKLCPELKTIPYDFEGYREVAFALYDTVAQYTLNIEAVSCDEMFVELTDMLQELQLDVMAFVGHLRQEVRGKTGCPCSAGVGSNKLLARMATKVAKPDGQHLLTTNDAAEYMAATTLDALPGVGHGMTYKLNQAGLRTCGDLQKIAIEQLETLLGKKSAQTIYQNCRGIDLRPLVYEQQRKSVSAEVNYGIRFTKAEECETFLRQLSAEVHSRLLEIKRKTKHITLKIMVRAAEAPVETSKFMGHGVCDNQSKSVVLKQSTDDVNTITSQVLILMRQCEVPPNELRGIGIQLSKLDEPGEEKKENVIKKMFVKMSEKQREKPTLLSTAAPAEPSTKMPAPENPKAKSRPNVLDMLKNASNKKSTVLEAKSQIETKTETPTTKATTSMFHSQFDPEILAQLPEDIRREVLAHKEEYLRSEVGHAKRKSSDNSASSAKRAPPPILPICSPLNASDFLPSTSRAALVKQQERVQRKSYAHANNTPQIVLDCGGWNELEAPSKSAPDCVSAESNNLLLQSNYKDALASWVETEEPLTTDVKLIEFQICELIEMNHFDQIYEVMKYFCRLIKSKRRESCLWHIAYNRIENKIQHRMLETLGYGLSFREAINCANCSAYPQ
ncbi:DNA repair protein REV1 [Scaptodrosophila lebanonensis]|uniref:DNA repair protein REV1 n=1 Tax=Drosophila lebanonensis TaxID=7225 RepID=A0A6J2T956_DROLE|nr:DNA repair protein REV1 [Scaptodrosophila lebanonensis]XP_030372545.1 DNA repair protein REV1 [Scaptodrosophila lebanonensis]